MHPEAGAQGAAPCPAARYDHEVMEAAVNASDTDVAELRRLLAALRSDLTRLDNEHTETTRESLATALVANADALLDAAEAVDRVTALADFWDGKPGDLMAEDVVASIRRCLAAPDNHDKNTP